MKENVKKCLEDFQFEMGVGNFVAMESIYQELKEKYGELVFEEDKKGHIRFRKKLYQSTYFERIWNNRIELPKEGIAYLNITKTGYTTIHMFENGSAIVTPSVRLSRIYRIGAFSSEVIFLDVANTVLELDEQNMIKANLHNGDVIKIEIEPTGIFLQKFEPDDIMVYMEE